MTTSEKYVTAAYCVVFAVVLVYVLLIAVKLNRLESEGIVTFRIPGSRRLSRRSCQR